MFAHMQPASGQVCFNSIDGHPGDVRDFFKALFFHIKEQQCGSFLGVEPVERQIEFLMFEPLVRFFGCNYRQAFHFGRTVAFSRSLVVAEAVVGDAEEPGGKRGTSAERIQMQKGLDEGLLGDVVGQSRIAPAEIAQESAKRLLAYLNLNLKVLPVHRISFVSFPSDRQ